jgi:YD repeat-containing protein
VDSRRTSVTRGNGVTTTYGYDTASRLASVAHDLAGTGQDQTRAFNYNPAAQSADAHLVEPGVRLCPAEFRAQPRAERPQPVRQRERDAGA